MFSYSRVPHDLFPFVCREAAIIAHVFDSSSIAVRARPALRATVIYRAGSCTASFIMYTVRTVQANMPRVSTADLFFFWQMCY